jgi:leucyl aminopeptidase
MNHIKFNIIDNRINNTIRVTLHKEIKNLKGNEFSRNDNFLKLNILKETYNTSLDYEYLGGAILEELLKYDGSFTLDLKDFEEDEAGFILNGIYLRSWTFHEFKTTSPKKISELNIEVKNINKVHEIFNSLKKVSDGVLFAKRMCLMPPNVIYPETFLEEVVKLFANEDVKITILDSKKIQEKNMNLLYGVGKGSKYPPYVMIIEKGNPTTALLGKGVTFDTGGINLKSADGMTGMKIDKTGAAVVVGAVYGSATPVMGVIGLVENMIGSNAQRLNDIVKSMKGDYVEILNTDAEGRLVLADLITLTQTYPNINEIIDIATLTGAVSIALGKEHAGLMSNNKKLVENLKLYGDLTGDKVWELPCGPEYDHYLTLNTDGDIKNLGPNKSEGGVIAGGKFLQYFINKGIKWAHLDIAGAHERKSFLNREMSNGFGVRLLTTYLKNKDDCCNKKTTCCN